MTTFVFAQKPKTNIIFSSLEKNPIKKNKVRPYAYYKMDKKCFLPII